jgi:putative FmdB family regulatory protein
VALYEYRCRDCGYQFEELRPIARMEADSECGKCGSSRIRRLPALTAERHFQTSPPSPSERIPATDGGAGWGDANVTSYNTYRNIGTAIQVKGGHLVVDDNRFINVRVAIDSEKARLRVRRNTME